MKPNWLLLPQLVVPAQHTMLEVMSSDPSPTSERVCDVRFAWVSIEFDGTGEPAGMLRYLVDDLPFHAAMFQSQMPYRYCVPGWKEAGTRVVGGNFCPVPKSIISRIGPVPWGTPTTWTLVVIGSPAGAVNSGVLEAAHAVSVGLVRSKRHMLPSKSPAYT